MIQRVDSLIQPLQDVSACLCFSEVEFRSSPDDLTPEIEKLLEQLLEIEYLWLPVNDGDVDDAERRLHSGQLIEFV